MLKMFGMELKLRGNCYKRLNLVSKTVLHLFVYINAEKSCVLQENQKIPPTKAKGRDL